MKSTTKSISLVAIIALIIVFCVILVLIQILPLVNAEAADTELGTTVIFSTNRDSVMPGESFVLNAKVETTNPGYWYGLSLAIVPIIESINGGNEVDLNSSQYLSVVKRVDKGFGDDYSYSTRISDNFKGDNQSLPENAVIFQLNCELVECEWADTSLTCNISAEINVSESIKGINKITFGLYPDKSDKVITFLVDENKTIDYAEYSDSKITWNNTSIYIMSNRDSIIELSDDSNYQFLIERQGSSAYEEYRRAYGELGWVHGIDDVGIERIVLGQIKPKTTVNYFLANIKEDLLPNIKLYDNLGKIIYDCGKSAKGIDDEFLSNARNYSVGTGWKIELMSGVEVIDTIYLSVLCDLNGDGIINGFDNMMLNEYITGQITFGAPEVKLAAQITNDGYIDAADSARLSGIIANTANIEEFFYKSKIE